MIRWLEKRRYFAIILTLLIAIEIFYFSSIPGITAPKGVFDLSIAYHFIVFFLLNFFLLISTHGKKEIKIKYLIFVIIISLAYSILDEVHQIFVPFRDYDIKDILIDSAGILTAAFIYLYYKKPRRRL